MPMTIGVQGLNEFNWALKRLDKGLPKMTRIAMNGAAAVVVEYGQGRIAVRSGRARKTIKARSTRNLVRVVEGGPGARYVPWLDFGGRVGRRKSVVRKFYSEGRYLYPALYDKRDEIEQALTSGLETVAREAGLTLGG